MAELGTSKLTGEERIFPEEVPPSRRELPRILDPFVAIWHAVRDWWQGLFVLTIASLVTSMLVVSVVASAPGIGAFMVLARSSLLHEDPTMMTFLYALRDNFWRAWRLGILGVLTVVVIYVDVPLYYSLVGQNSGLVGVLTLIVLYVLMLCFQTFSYAWAMFAIRDDLNTWTLLRNGVLLVVRYPVHNLVTTLFVALLLYASAWLPPLLILVVPPLSALLALHNLYVLAPEIAPKDVDALRIAG